MLDVREIYGVSPWQRERFDLLAEEAIRLGHATHAAGQFGATLVIVSENSSDGHNAVLQPVTKLRKLDPVTGDVTYEDVTPLVDTPIHFASGGGVTHTYAVQKGDEGFVLHASRDFDAWRQSGGTQQPMDNGINNAGQGVHIPGVRSDPRKLQQVSSTSAQLRSDDGHHTIDHHPGNGTTVKSVDPATPPASASFSPFQQASKFVSHAVIGGSSVVGSAVDGGTTHSHGVDHDQGAWMSAANLEHIVRAHPQLGALLSALGGQHLVQAHPDNGVTVSSQKAVQIQSQGPLSLSSAMPGGLSLSGLAGGSIGSSALAQGAASSNVGSVGGDVSGTLPTLNVVGIGNVDATNLPHAANDSEAAAAGVALNHLYVNTGAVSGVGLLAVRLV